jgi:hypothetical protein
MKQLRDEDFAAIGEGKEKKQTICFQTELEALPVQ